MKAVKVLLLAFAALLLVVLAGAAIFLATLDANDYKDRLVARVKAETGRDLTLEGPLELAFWPKIRLQAGPLSLSNAPGFGDQPMLAARELRIAVATWPLLSKRVEMDTVVLHGVSLNLARDAEGRGNWQDLVPETDERQSASGDGFAALILGGLDVKDGRLHWQDARSGQNLVVDRITAATGALTFGEPIALTLSARVDGQQPAVAGDIEASGTLEYDLDAEHYVLAPFTAVTTLRGAQLPGGNARLELAASLDLDRKAGTAKLGGLSFTGLGTTLRGEFSARDIDADQPSANATLTVQGEDLALLFNALGLPAGKQLARVSDRTFALDLAFDADMRGGVVKLDKLEGRLLGASLDGAFTATEADTDQPKAQGRLTARGPDLPALLAVLGQMQGASAASLKQLDQALAGSADKSFSLAADLDVDLAAGRAALPKLDGKLLGNLVQGHLEVRNATSKSPAAQGELTASGPDFPGLLAVGAALAPQVALLTDMAHSLAREQDKSFRLETHFDADLAGGRVSLPKLQADVAGIALRGQLEGTDVNLEKKTGSLDGKLALTSTELGPLLRALGQGEMAGNLRSLNIDAGVQGGLAALTLRPLNVVARVASPELDKPVDLKLSAAAATADLDHQTARLEGLSVTGLGLDARMDLDAEHILSEPAYRGKLSVPAFNLRRLLTALGKPAPDTADPKALTRVGFASRIEGTSSGVKFDELALTLDDSRLTGQLDIAAFSGPDLRFGLALDTLDADRYLAAPQEGKGKTVVTPDAAVAGAASSLPVKQLRKLKMKGDVTVGTLTLSGAKMTKVKLAIDAAKGLVRLDPLAAQLYDGSYRGAVQLDARPKVVRIALDTKLDKVQVEPLLKDVAQNDSLSGVVGFGATLAANGGNARRARQTLSGDGRFAFERGVFRGVDAVAILRAVEKIIECKCVVPVPKGGQTAFKSLTGTLAVNNGVVRNEDLLMQGEGFTIKGRGMLVNLNDKSLKYDLALAVTESRATAGTDKLKLGGYTVPIACRGQVQKPSCLPDFGHILGEVAKSSVKQKIKERLGGQGGEALQKLLEF